MAKWLSPNLHSRQRLLQLPSPREWRHHRSLAKGLGWATPVRWRVGGKEGTQAGFGDEGEGAEVMGSDYGWQTCKCGKTFRGYPYESCPDCTEAFKRAVKENPHGNLPK